MANTRGRDWTTQMVNILPRVHPNDHSIPIIFCPQYGNLREGSLPWDVGVSAGIQPRIVIRNTYMEQRSPFVLDLEYDVPAPELPEGHTTRRMQTHIPLPGKDEYGLRNGVLMFHRVEGRMRRWLVFENGLPDGNKLVKVYEAFVETNAQNTDIVRRGYEGRLDYVNDESDRPRAAGVTADGIRWTLTRTG